jgi:hypothetical protein
MLLPPPWDAYLRLQTSLDDITKVNNRSWGIEAGLDAILAGAGVPGSLLTTMATAERRERHRARLRRTFSTALRPVVDQPARIEARIALGQIQRLLSLSDWQLISSVAAGLDYASLAISGARTGGLRVRVMRLRESLNRIAA